MEEEQRRLVRYVASEANHDEQQLPDEKRNRRPMLVVRHQKQTQVPGPVIRNKCPFIPKEVHVAGEVKHAYKNEH